MKVSQIDVKGSSWFHKSGDIIDFMNVIDIF